MKEQVFLICDRLIQAGVKPTAQRVREELGGGSFSTISPLLKEWRDSQGDKEAVPDIPPEAQKAVYQATALLWRFATEHQAEAINAVRQECHRIEQEALAERDEALREIEILEKNLNLLESELKDKARLELQVQKQQMALDSTLKSCEELKAENQALRKQVSTAQNEASRLTGMLEAFQLVKSLEESPDLKKPARTTKTPRKPKT